MTNSNLIGVGINPVALADYFQNYVRTSDAGDGTSYFGGSIGLVNLNSASRGENTAGTTFVTTGISSIALDILVTSITGGTLPTVQFFFDRVGVDGSTYFNIWSSQAFSGAGQVSVNLGDAVPSVTSGSVQSTPCVFTDGARLRWVFGGTIKPTSTIFTVSIVGR